METHKKMKMEQMGLKLYIFACGFGLTAYAGLLCFDMRSPIAEWLSMSFAFVLLTGGAWAFRLCWLSYLFILYMYVIRCCMILQTIGFFGDWLDIAHQIAFGIGLILCATFTFRFKTFLNCTKDEDAREYYCKDVERRGR